MKFNRRKFLKTSLTIGTAGIALLDTSLVNAGWSAADFAPDSFGTIMNKLAKGKPIVETDGLTINIPEIAENGALVPVTVSSSLKDIKNIAIVVEQNPVPLTIQITITPEIVPFMSARLKLASSSFVFALAESEKACYSVKKKVKVTIGGCGG